MYVINHCTSTRHIEVYIENTVFFLYPLMFWACPDGRVV